MNPAIRRLISWSVLAAAFSFLSLIAAGGVIVVGIFLEMCSRPHTLRWGALGFGLLAGFALMSVEWYHLFSRETWWADASAGGIKVLGYLVIISGFAGYVKLEQRYPPPVPTGPGRTDKLFQRMESTTLAFLDKNDNFWARVQAKPVGNSLIWIVSLALWGVLLGLVLGVRL